MEQAPISALELTRQRLASHQAILEKMKQANKIIANTRFRVDALKELIEVLGFSGDDAIELLTSDYDGVTGYSQAQLDYVQEQIDQLQVHIKTLENQ